MDVWLMPCHRHRFDKHIQSDAHRWNMVNEVTGQYPWMVACDWEIAHQHNGSMFETLIGLEANYPHDRFHIVIGMDNANVIDAWDRGKLLIDKNPFIVLSRGESTTDWHTKPPHRSIFADEIGESSTLIREAICRKNFDLASKHLNSRVWDYIRMGKLYGA